MSRKDTEKDSDRPHYYSQFWLDIASGRRTVGGPRPAEEEVAEEAPAGKAEEAEAPAGEEIKHPVVDDEDESSDEEYDEDEEPYEEEEFYDEEEEEDEDLEWGRGRKKVKPARPTKPVRKAPGKPETRRRY